LNDIQQYFSSDKQPTLWRALPALEELQTAWEKKRDTPRFTLYKDALSDGLEKVRKYYSQLDEKPNFVLALGEFLVNLVVYNLNSVQCFTLTTSSHISNFCGGAQKTRQPKLRWETPTPRIGRMKPKRSLKRQ